MRIAAAWEIRNEDPPTLVSWTRSSSMRAALAQRARIVLLAGQKMSNSEIAARVEVARPTVNLWRQRYVTGGLAALGDTPRSRRPVVVDETQIVVRTLETPSPRVCG